MTNNAGLVVGIGSVGRRHAAVMAKRYEQLFVVDSSPAALGWAKENLSCRLHLGSSIDEVASEVRAHADSTTAVIASWGPAHYEHFVALSELGVRRIFCEKPVATSLRQLSDMRAICERNDIKMTAGLHLRYRGIAEFVNAVSRESLGGEPTSFVVDGGARCVATTGSHWLDLAAAVYGIARGSVVAHLRDSAINPRSPSLRYWEGTAIWEFSGVKCLTITYDNSSSVHERARFYAPTGVVDIDNDLVCRARARDPRQLRDDPRTVRVGEVTTDVLAEHVPDLNEVLTLQLDEIEGKRPITYGLDQVFDSAEALVLAFEASRVGRRLQFPATPDVLANCVDWNIS